MRSVRRLLLCLAFLACAIPARAQTPAAMQTCKKANGGSSIENYTVTIGSSGGSTGCTSNYTSGNAILIAYHQLSGSSDRTTSNISTTGATITWHKAVSVQNGVYGPPGYWSGIFYACGGDITSPTSSIAVTVDMGASMAGLTAIYGQEVQNVQQTSCLDKTGTGSDCCGGQFSSGLSGTLSNASEYAFATGVTIGKQSGARRRQRRILRVELLLARFQRDSGEWIRQPEQHIIGRRVGRRNRHHVPRMGFQSITGRNGRKYRRRDVHRGNSAGNCHPPQKPSFLRKGNRERKCRRRRI